MSLHFVQQNQKRHITQRGFTMLLAVVTGSILLLIAAGMASIALKEQVLASSARDSQIALYMADSGMECALYLDQKLGAFATTTATNSGPLNQVLVNTYCGTDLDATAGKITPVYNTNVTNSAITWTFKVTFPITLSPAGAVGLSSCSVIEVSKRRESADVVKTSIDARGYNTCDASNRRLERGIKAYY